jgi:5-methyltetrahydrofolate corrinoid/iron sulfur protein methyltransferase
MSKFYRIGENLNVVTKVYGQAMKDRNPKPLQELAVKEAEAGVDFIDVNIGPARKGGEELMEWIVKAIQEVVPNVPLALDTSNIAAMEAGLKVHKGRALINSIMARPERMDGMMPLVKKYDADMIGLMWGPEGMPRDEHERGMLTAEILAKAAEYDIENERIWFDPIIAPLNIQQNQLIATLDYMHMLQDMAPGSKSTCGLSNCSNGVPDDCGPSSTAPTSSCSRGTAWSPPSWIPSTRNWPTWSTARNRMSSKSFTISWTANPWTSLP